MRTLIVTRFFLGEGEQPVTGTYRRFGLFLDAIARLGGDCHLLIFVPPDFEVTSTATATYQDRYSAIVGRRLRLTLVNRGRRPPPSLKGYLNRPWDLFSPGLFAYHTTSGPVQLAAVRAALEEAPDLVFVHKLLGIAPFLKGRLRHERVVLDLDDVEHVGFIRNLLGPPHYLSKPLGLLHFPALLRGEFQAVRHARLSFVCSSSDARYLNRLLVTDRVEVVPNAVELPDHLPLAESPTILFLGSNAYAPNLAAADRLVERIFPLVRRVVPTAQLLLAGEYPEAIRSFNHPPEGVRFLGFVQDLKALYAETRVVACPIMSGSGTRVKLVEAAGYGRPIVSTRIGAEGLELVPEKSILLADDDAAMAEALVRVLRDELLAIRLAESARGIAVDRYDRAQVTLALIARLDMLMKDSVGP